MQIKEAVKTVIIVLTALLISNLAFNLSAAETSKIKFTQITQKEGFFAPNIGAMLQDHKGFIWFGTYQSAIVRYDGINFKVYGNKASDPGSFPPVQVSGMYQDKYNTFWIGTSNGLVAFNLDTEKITYYTQHSGDPDSIAGGGVSCIYEDKTETLWIGTREGGLNLFNRTTGKFSHYKNDPADPESLANNNITSICEDQEGTIWIGTDHGVDTFNPGTGKFLHRQIILQDANNIGSSKNNYVYSIVKDRSGILWIATDNGLNQYDQKTQVFKRYTRGAGLPANATLIYEGPVSGKLWVVLLNAGLSSELYEFDRKTEEFIFISSNNPEDPDSLSLNSIASILEDKSGMLWIGGFGGYLNTAKLVKKKFVHIAADPDSAHGFHGGEVHSFAQDASGLIWVSSTISGIHAFNRKTNQFVKSYAHDPKDPDSLLTNTVYTLMIDNAGDLWAGTIAGISRLSRKTGKFVHYKEGLYNIYNKNLSLIFALYQDPQGEIWSGGLGGFAHYDREKNQFVPYRNDPQNQKSMSDSNVISIIEDQDGIMWLSLLGGTKGGLVRFDKSKGEFTHYANDPENLHSLSNNVTYAVYEDSTRTLWVATKQGLNRFNKEKEEFTVFTEDDGLAGNQAMGIIEDDDGNLWISTVGGITRYDRKKGTFRSYYADDGLNGDNFGHGCIKTADGELFFGGYHGINAFYPREITDNPYIPPVAITELKLFNKTVPIGKMGKRPGILEKSITETSVIKLLYNDYVFSFEFAALSFIDSHNNQYAYFMEGFEKEWNFSENRNFATYTNLDAGEYFFRVKASNNDGKWNEEGIRLKVRVLPPFWEIWWFRIIIVVLLVVIVAAGFNRTLKTIRKKHKDQLMKRDVEIAGNIQTSLLPDLGLFSDSEYALEGNMHVAESVGGDYYDVIKGIDGRLWLGVGDASGHGISAGLIMMMTQVAIHNLIGNVPGITPAELLIQANKIITNNIRKKMKTNHYMTILFLVENNPGHFEFAGAHEVILIHRAKTGEVIQVETHGFWLGILEDCTLQMRGSKGEFQLEKNDTLLLYTDGLTEIMNSEREQFELKRLISVMKDNCENPQKLKIAINNAIKNFGGIQTDDITFLICRRK